MNKRAAVASWPLSGDLPFLIPVSYRSTMLLMHHSLWGRTRDRFLNPRSVRDGGQEWVKGTHLSWQRSLDPA